MRRHARARQLSNIIIIYAVHYRRGKTNSPRCAMHGCMVSPPATYFRSRWRKMTGKSNGIFPSFHFIGISVFTDLGGDGKKHKSLEMK